MAKQIIEGKIDKVFVKDFGEADQYGNQYGVNINVGGEWYGLGKKKKPVANVKQGAGWHQLAQGDVIEAVCETVERNGRTFKNVKASDITVKEVGSGSNSNGSGHSSNSGVSNATASGVSSNDNRQEAIMRQSAMGYAAQIVAATITSKSNVDDAAEQVLRIANEWFLPYAKTGKTDDYEAEENELKNQEAAQAADDEEFNDDLPF